MENFQHKYDLVEAEKARVLGNYWEAEELYEQAIQGAKRYEFIHEEARLSPPKLELEDFYADVRELEQDVERLESRAEKLRRRLQKLRS